MDGMQGLMDALLRSAVDEAFRFAWIATRWIPAAVVVGSAAVMAGLLGAAALLKVGASRTAAGPRGLWQRWLVVAMLSLGALPLPPARADVLCRVGRSHRLVVRAERCRPRERATTPQALGVDGGGCIDGIAEAWQALEELRARLESGRELAARLAVTSWDGADTWLAIEAAAARGTAVRLQRLAAALGAGAAADPLETVTRSVGGGSGRSASAWADAFTEALAVLPSIEAALLAPPGR